MSADWIILDNRPPSALCRHCGARQALSYGMREEEFGALVSAFEKRHRACPRPRVIPTPERAARQLPLQFEGVLS